MEKGLDNILKEYGFDNLGGITNIELLENNIIKVSFKPLSIILAINTDDEHGEGEFFISISTDEGDSINKPSDITLVGLDVSTASITLFLSNNEKIELAVNYYNDDIINCVYENLFDFCITIPEFKGNKKIIQKTHFIDINKYNEIQAILDKDIINFEKEDFEEDAIIYEESLKFDSNISVLIKVCTGQSNAWVEAILLDNGDEVSVTDADFSLLGEYNFEYNNKNYIFLLESN